MKSVPPKTKKGSCMEPFKDSKLFNQPGFKKAVKTDEYPAFDIESVFDHHHKEGKEIALAKKKKKKCRDNLVSSFFKKGDASNKSYYKYQPF